MKYVLTSAQMKQADANTMGHFGMLSAVLMERAAMAAVEEITARFPKKETRILIACGTGNNGGDGIAMARLLFLAGYPAAVLFPGKEEKCSVECARQLDIARRYQVPIFREFPEGDWDVVADALFGIGLDRAIGGIYAPLIERLNALPAYKVAVDISSGISADTGQIMGIAFRADLTATFGFAKAGQLLYPGAQYTGTLAVKDIGIDETSLRGALPGIRCLGKEDLAFLPGRKAYSNKGSYGKLLIIAGSRNMAGAAALSGKAACRMGTGLVKIVTPEPNREIIQSLLPEAILSTYTDETDIPAYVQELTGWADAVVAGPGIGVSDTAAKIVKVLLETSDKPLLLDADALNLIAVHPEWLPAAGNAQVVITPHLGEMSRLTGLPVPELQKDLIGCARQFAADRQAVTVLKDARTVTAAPDGTTWINRSGNNGMATAGSGDVLSGIIGALLAQGVVAQTAASLGVYVHGLAGDAASAKVGQAYMMASDIVKNLKTVRK